MNSYSMEELLPVVADLTEHYTSRDSTSVSYDKARQLMGAVIYSIEEFERNQASMNTLMSQDNLDAMSAFRLGQDSIKIRIQKLTFSYNTLAARFRDYGNRNYRDTFTGGISGFLKYYDYRYYPQNTIITMDYPVLKMPADSCGIIAVEQYFHCIWIEQQFLSHLPEDYIVAVLTAHEASYTKQFYNISSIICRNLLGCMIAGKDPQDEPQNEDYDKINKFIDSNNRTELCEKLIQILKVLVDNQYQGNPDIFEYFKSDMSDLAAELLNATRYNTIKNVITL